MTPKKEKVRISDIEVVIPTLNEEEAIGRVLDEVYSVGVKPDQVLIVDGHSTDRTREIAQEKGAKVILQEGKGKADAIKTAIKHITRPYMLVMDGDYTYPATEIPKLVEKANESYDEVIGARLYGRENIPLLHRFGNWIITRIFNLFFGTKLRDVLSGMYLVKLNLVRNLPIESKGFSIEVDIAAKVASITGKITEVPIYYRERIGKKKLRMIHGALIVKDIVKLAWRYNPAFIVLILGALLFVPGLAINLWVLVRLLFYGIKHHIWAIIGTLILSSGVLTLALAVITIYLKRFEYRITHHILEIRRELNDIIERLNEENKKNG